MSRAAKTTLFLTTLACGATVLSVHYIQRAERASMYEGVIRDEERTRIKRERQEDFDLQTALREQLLKVQNVKDTSSEGDHRNTLDAGKS